MGRQALHRRCIDVGPTPLMCYMAMEAHHEPNERHCIAPPFAAFLIMLMSGSGLTRPASPVLASVNPSEGPVGTQVTLLGSGFTASENTVHFGIGGSKGVPSENGTSIRYTIPRGVSSCDLIASNGPRCMAPVMRVDAGIYEIFVANANGRTSALTFTVR